MRLIPQPPGKIVDGQILYNGLDLLDLPANKMRKIRGKEISMIFQEPMTSLNPVFTVRRADRRGAAAARGPGPRATPWTRRSRCCRLVHIPNAERRVKEYPHQLSGGMRQRVMIAMALSCSPNLLIADEPTTALDVTIQAQILELLNELKSKLGMAVMLITHDLGVVAETAQRVVVMYAGQGRRGSPGRRPVQGAAAPVHAGAPAVHPADRASPPAERLRLETIPGMVPTLRDIAPGCRFARALPVREIRLHRAGRRCSRKSSRATQVLLLAVLISSR